METVGAGGKEPKPEVGREAGEVPPVQETELMEWTQTACGKGGGQDPSWGDRAQGGQAQEVARTGNVGFTLHT